MHLNQLILLKVLSNVNLSLAHAAYRATCNRTLIELRLWAPILEKYRVQKAREVI